MARIINPLNSFSTAGRLVNDFVGPNDPQGRSQTVFANSDGSHKVFVKIAVDEPYTDKNGEKVTQFIAMEDYIPAGNKPGLYGFARKGALVSVNFSIDTKPYTKNGETVYPTTLRINSIQMIDSGPNDPRRAQGQQAQAQQGQPVEQPQPQAPAQQAPVADAGAQTYMTEAQAFGAAN